MKKLYIILLVTSIMFFGCNKYKEGPLISFRTVSKRLQGTWQVTGYMSNDVDSLQYYNDSCGASLSIDELVDDDWQFITGFSNGKKMFSAVFNLSQNNTVLNVKSDPETYYKFFTGPFSPNCKTDWHILKLTNKEFKVIVDFNNTNYKISFKKN